MAEGEKAKPIEGLLDADDLAEALESDRFRQFLDQIPIAIALSDLPQPGRGEPEAISYVNLEFQRLTGRDREKAVGGEWSELVAEGADGAAFEAAITSDQDPVGPFRLAGPDGEVCVEAWSNVIQDEDGTPVHRLVAIVESTRDDEDRGELERRIREQDTQLRELQHRVKNNLQMITALIRMEARKVTEGASAEMLERLAGRVDALALLYRALSGEGHERRVDLGIYLSQIASAVMAAHAGEGIRFDLKVDTWPVPLEVAMPTGLVVNEVLTNSLKHAFAGREGGTITLRSLVADDGCRVVIADDGIGLPEGAAWPQSGKLGALIVQALRQNARARIEVVSRPGEGVRATLFFPR